VQPRLRTALVALTVAGALTGGTVAYAASSSSSTTTTTPTPNNGTTDPGQLEGQGQAPSQSQGSQGSQGGQGHSGHCPGM
jgi:hypothetical protein